MKDFLQDLLGITELKQANQELQKQVEILTSQSKTEQDASQSYLSRFSEKKEYLQEWLSNMQDLQKMELSIINEKLNQLLPPSLNAKYLEMLNEIDFIAEQKLKAIDVNQLSRKIEGATLVSKKDAEEGLLANLLAGSASAGIAKYITKGLYTTTAKPEQLMKYTNGGYASILREASKITNHIGFTQAGFMSMAPILAFQAATMITSQIHLKQINQNLEKIDERVKNLVDFHKNERTAKLKYINQKINEFSNRRFFTTEDFVMMEQFKYDLQVITEEGTQFFVNTLVDKFQKLGIDIVARYDLVVIKEDRQSIWKMFKEKTNLLNQNLVNLIEKSKLKIEDTIKDLQASQIFFYAEVSITAEKMYESLLLLELTANLKVQQLDRDRIGKIDELRSNMEEYDKREKKGEMIYDFYKMFKNGFGSFVAQKRKAAFDTSQAKIDDVLDKFEKDLSILKNLLDIGSDSKFLNKFYDEYEIIIDNSGEQELMYMKKLAI